MTFYRETPIKSVRKARLCHGCGKQITVGESALQCAGYVDEFWSGTYHTDCRAAECTFNDLKDYRPGDDWYALNTIEQDDFAWLAADYPDVAARMGVTLPENEQ